MGYKNYTSFNIDGNEYKFSTQTFKMLFNNKAKKDKKKITQLEEELAEKVYVTSSAVHAWRMGSNTPGDFEKIKDIAEFLGVDHDMLLMEIPQLLEREEMTTITDTTKLTLTDREKDALNKVYYEILDFVRKYGKFIEDDAEVMFRGFRKKYTNYMISENNEDIYEPIKEDMDRYIDFQNYYITEMSQKGWDCGCCVEDEFGRELYYEELCQSEHIKEEGYTGIIMNDFNLNISTIYKLLEKLLFELPYSIYKYLLDCIDEIYDFTYAKEDTDCIYVLKGQFEVLYGKKLHQQHKKVLELKEKMDILAQQISR